MRSILFGASAVALAEAGSLKLAWKDCGGGKTPGTVTGLSPDSIPLGSKSTVTGSGTTTQAVSGGTFEIDLKASIISQKYSGDLCSAKSFNLPLGTGTITWDGVKCPIAAGALDIPVDITLSSKLPTPLQNVQLTISGADTSKTDLLCMQINTSPAEGELTGSDCETEYKAYLAAFPEKSASAERSAIFCSNLARIEKHNAGNSRYTMGINKFSDWTDDEVSGLLGATDTHRPELPAFEVPANMVLKPEIDWRSRMPAVKNQESCGSCWAFSAIDVVDFYGGSHSEQQLLDCSGGSCNGYNSQSALQYLSQAGSDTESQYPYTARKGSCHARSSSDRVSSVRSLRGASSIQAALQSQVVSVSFQLSERGSPFMHYSGGVYDSPCGSGAGHAVGAVGYSGDYWIIRNSWGSGWGVGGYVYFKKGEDLCKLESWMPVTAHASGAVVV